MSSFFFVHGPQTKGSGKHILSTVDCGPSTEFFTFAPCSDQKRCLWACRFCFLQGWFISAMTSAHALHFRDQNHNFLNA